MAGDGFFVLSFSEGKLKGLMLGFGVDWMDNDRTIPVPGNFGFPGDKEWDHLVEYWAFNLVLGYEWRWGNYDYRIRLNIKNLTDEK